MSTLSVSSIQNTASPTTNIVVNADGSVTLGLYRTPSVAPTPVQIGTLWYDIGGAGLVIWDGAAWASAGGGGGTVTGVAGTAPIVSSGGATPAISITPATSGAAGSMSAADKAKLDGAATIVSAVTGTLPITVATGTSTPVIAINAATTAATGSVQLATAAENAAGTDATKAVTPAFSVPKDAANMTGAALIPGGNDAARPTPVTGMVRYNNQSGIPALMEYYDGANWKGMSGYGGQIQAWVNFDGVPASPTIRASANVSSVTKNGTGDYTVNFTTALPDNNYATVLGGNSSDNGSSVVMPSIYQYSSNVNYATTTSIRVTGASTGGGGPLSDIPVFNAAIFR